MQILQYLNDDTIYILLLVGSILFGKFYKEIESLERKKLIGTAIGLTITLIVSGTHIFHTLFSTLICALIILFIDKRKAHLVSFGFMFGYLIFFRTCDRFGFSTPPGHTNLIQMILTLKLVGLAFERNSVYTIVKSNPSGIGDYERNILKISPIEIIHYSFNYIGILTGPYFRYRTFYDYFTLPFQRYANCGKATVNKFMWVPLFAIVFLFTSYYWPLSYTLSDEFYAERSFIYRFLYIWPSFLIFRMRIYIGITLSECVCTMAGFGAYPIQVESTPGCGPTKNYVELSTNHPDKLEYNFETIKNIDPYATDTCTTLREAMKHWNMCVQYWLAINIYKRFPSKKYRMLVTLFISAFWHGVYSGYYLCILGAPFYLPIEDLYHKLFRKDGTGVKLMIWNGLFWISKFFTLSYLGIAFLLLSLEKIWFYYCSVYHLGYVYFAVLYGVGLLILKSTRQRSSKITENRNLQN